MFVTTEICSRYEKPRNEVRSQCQGQSDHKWYAALRHPKMYPHTKFEILTSNNIGDMHRSGTNGRADGQCDYYMPPKVPLGHKNKDQTQQPNAQSEQIKQ